MFAISHEWLTGPVLKMMACEDWTTILTQDLIYVTEFNIQVEIWL